jgi:hypothetical protein
MLPARKATKLWSPRSKRKREIESRGATVHWLSLGELSKLIETFRREGVTRAVMAGTGEA